MHFGDKVCCVEDLVPYIAFDGDDLSQWTSFLDTHKSFVSYVSVNVVVTLIVQSCRAQQARCSGGSMFSSSIVTICLSLN